MVTNKHNSLSALKQGMIFNGVLTEDKEGYGIVVTADCDIAQEKVKSIYYISTLSLKDFICVHFCQLIIDEEFSNANLDAKYIRLALNDGYKPETLISDNKNREKLLRLISSIQNDCSGRCILKATSRKKIENKVKEITKGSLIRFHFIQTIREDYLADGYVADFQDIRTMPLEVAKEISLGFVSENPIQNYRESGLSSSDGVLEPLGCMSSPYREHFMQRFAHYFIRIGLADIPKNLEVTLVEKF